MKYCKVSRIWHALKVKRVIFNYKVDYRVKRFLKDSISARGKEEDIVVIL